MVELRYRREGDRGVARVKVFGIDPGSERTGYGCVETDGSRHRIITCGAVSTPAADSFSGQLFEIHRPLAACAEPEGWRPRIIPCGAVSTRAADSFSGKLFEIHRRLVELLAECHLDSVAIENIF